MFLMLNPSAPNASCDDPTIRRCRSRTSQGRKRQHATLSGQIILSTGCGFSTAVKFVCKPRQDWISGQSSQIG
ncbi:DUF1643 domain-containing protein [Paraburkholderia sp. WC7.3g]|uniref:DUF1643 domain-containing protein n=1 Tax=Paraburkholderia sp. WC7.3g TaxID=2991070 RepID=UPI003D21E3DF